MKKNPFIVIPCFFYVLTCSLLFSYQISLAADSHRADKNQVTAIITRDMQPSSFRDPQTGEPSGFCVELMDAVAKKAGITVSYIYAGDWEEIEKALQTGKADICPVFSATDKRQEYTLFTEPIEVFGITVNIRAQSRDIHGLVDLKGRNVAVIKASQAYELLKENNDIHLKQYQSFQTAIFDLLSGQVNAFIAPNHIISGLIQQAGIEEQVAILSPPLKEIKRAIGVRKGRQDLFERLSTAVKDFVSGNEYPQLFIKWYGKPAPFWTMQRILLALGLILFITIAGMACWRYVDLVKMNRSLKENISERKKAEALLRESEDRFKNAMQATRDGLWDWDRTTGISYFSPGCYRMLDYEPGEFPMTAMAWIDLIHPDDRARAFKINDDCMQNRTQSFESEMRMQTKSGGWKWILARGSAVKRDAQGKALRMIGTYVDINERKRIDEEFLRQKIFSDTLIQASPAFIVAIGNTGTTLLMNDAMLAALGYCREEVIGKDYLTTFVPAEEQEQVRRIFASLITKHALTANENRVLAKDGSTILVEWHGRAFLKDDALDYFIGVGIDITARRQAENEIKQSRDLLETLFKTSPDIIMLTDAEGTIAAINSAVDKILGYRPDELIGRHSTVLQPEDEAYKKMVGTMIHDLFEKEYVINHELYWRKKDGSSCPLECSSVLLKNDAGDVIGATSFVRDITDRKHMEDIFRQSQKMEAIGTLAGGIAHDFNNILAAIIGFAEISLDAAPQESRLRKNLEQILKSGMRARDLVRQILAFSRKDISGRAPVHLHSVIMEAIRMLRASLPATIEIRTHIDEPNGMVSSNPTLLHQVLMNLCTNAAHAMSENGGVLDITLTPVEIAEPEKNDPLDLRPGSYVRLTVSDTGTGIGPEIIDRIFDPFFTTKPVGKGTGMGLAVVHGIVKSHGGSITVESSLGKGSSFHIMLPVIREQPQDTADDEEPLSKGSERILFIDDEETLIDVWKTQLESLGYTVTAVRSSIEALRLFQNNPRQFDLLITDQTMPGMTGDMLAQMCMECRPDIPVILCTGYSEKVSEERTKELGIKAFIMKPINRRELADTIRKVLHNG